MLHRRVRLWRPEPIAVAAQLQLRVLVDRFFPGVDVTVALPNDSLADLFDRNSRSDRHGEVAGNDR